MSTTSKKAQKAKELLSEMDKPVEYYDVPPTKEKEMAKSVPVAPVSEVVEDEAVEQGQDLELSGVLSAATVPAVEEDTTDQEDEDAEASEEAVDEEPNLSLIDAPRCLVCSHFIGDIMPYATSEECAIEPIAFDKCYYKNGGKNCPAEHYRIAIGVNIPFMAKKLMQGMLASDLELIGKVHKRLKRVDPFIARQVYQLASKLVVEANNE